MELPSLNSHLLRIFSLCSTVNRGSAQLFVALPEKSLFRLVAPPLLLLMALLSNNIYAQDYSVQQLKEDVANFLAAHYSEQNNERLEINVGNLDNRLRLETCQQQINFELQDPTDLGGNISVQANCPITGSWSVYIPAQVIIYRQIPVALRTIARGERLTDKHLGQQLVNISSIRQGYALLPENIVGMEAKRHIAQGEPFKLSSLAAPTAIKRGETVTLQAKAGAIKVVSAGTALADGRIGQRIRVRNSSSERIVTGVVVNTGLVQTL